MIEEPDFSWLDAGVAAGLSGLHYYWLSTPGSDEPGIKVCRCVDDGG